MGGRWLEEAFRGDCEGGVRGQGRRDQGLRWVWGDPQVVEIAAILPAIALIDKGIKAAESCLHLWMRCV